MSHTDEEMEQRMDKATATLDTLEAMVLRALRFSALWKRAAKRGMVMYQLTDSSRDFKAAADLANQRALTAERSARAWKRLAKEERTARQGIERVLECASPQWGTKLLEAVTRAESLQAELECRPGTEAYERMMYPKDDL